VTGTDAGIVHDWLGGNCPVQAEGRVDGVPFYFRARGSHWKLHIGEDPLGRDSWSYGEDYGTWPEAGWMTEDEARAFIEKAVAIYRKEGIIAPITA